MISTAAISLLAFRYPADVGITESDPVKARS
jgi:hypothetical protein